MLLIAAFNISTYSSTDGRISKPFNPILGETFELRRPEFDYFSEQVSHHPPITACHAVDKENNFDYWMNSEVKTAFWGMSLEIIPVGMTHIKLNNYNEIYSIDRPSTIIHNIIVG
jgi:hypothetical protein